MSPSQAIPPAAKRPRIGERTMLACIGCKQKKLKCDGQSPKCQNCAKTGRGSEEPSHAWTMLMPVQTALSKTLQQDFMTERLPQVTRD
ncbi:hypothetical protein BDV12DRAFT_201196 [Aspergillus spectabilis]